MGLLAVFVSVLLAISPGGVFAAGSGGSSFKETPVIRATTQRQLDALRSVKGASLFLVTHSSSSTQMKTIGRFAERIHTQHKEHVVIFAAISHYLVADDDGVDGNAIYYYPNPADNPTIKVLFTQELTLANLLAFWDAQQPPIKELIPRNFEAITGSGKSVVWIMLDGQETQKDVLRELAPLVQKFADEIIFSWVDVGKWSSHLHRYGLPTDVTPQLIVQDDFEGPIAKNFNILKQDPITADVTSRLLLAHLQQSAHTEL